MKEYNQYVNAVNKIYELVSKLKKWNDPDNQNYIENIERHKQAAIEGTKLFTDINKASNGGNQ